MKEEKVIWKENHWENLFPFVLGLIFILILFYKLGGG